jgi:hypothetical protein
MAVNTAACNDIGYYEVELEPITTNTCGSDEEPRYTNNWKFFLTISGGTLVVSGPFSDNYTHYVGETLKITYPTPIYNPS